MAVRERTATKVRSLPGTAAELRTVFHGPPIEFLELVFQELVKDGGVKVEAANGQSVIVPILLHSESATEYPQVGHSGVCAGVHLNDFRNQPGCPKFVALVAPGNHPSLALTIESASDSFGLDVRSNSGNATIEDWWNDDFIQSLVNGALDRFAISKETDREQARQMIQRSVHAADEAERHGVSRIGAWRILSRIYCIPGNAKVCPLLSLACGFPTTDDGELAMKDQYEVLQRLASHLEENGITKGLEELKEEAEPADIEALDAFSVHLHAICDIPTTFARAASYFYSPCRGDDLASPPKWWMHLTLERWVELLEEERRPEGALRIECTNFIFPPFKGGHSVVHREVDLLVSAPEDQAEPVQAVLIRPPFLIWSKVLRSFMGLVCQTALAYSSIISFSWSFSTTSPVPPCWQLPCVAPPSCWPSEPDHPSSRPDALAPPPPDSFLMLHYSPCQNHGTIQYFTEDELILSPYSRPMFHIVALNSVA